MIIVEDLTKQFDDFIAVNGIHLNVSAGQVLALLGPNGAGKTTTVRMLTSILRPTRGYASVAGFDVVKQARQVRASVGVLTEHHGLYNRMNADEYLDFYRQLYNVDKTTANQRINSLMERFGLAQARHKRLGEYSKGMRQKLALVRVLLHEPPVLLLDEPTSAMDPESARVVRDAILSLRSQDVTIILCTHNLAEAEELADQIAIIRRGNIVFNDTVAALKEHFGGARQYEMFFAHSLAGWRPTTLPEGVALVEAGDDQFRFTVKNPQQSNPQLLRLMIENGKEVVSMQEVPRSLEKAYLEAVNQYSREGVL
ncbi:MAG: ABC transporter ATP-binding protein [Anaerolineae bacterium]|nr:ABC transporter ATP-binding protein [Anaerolineae bacterium]